MSPPISASALRRGVPGRLRVPPPPTLRVMAANRKSGVESRLPTPVLRKALFLVRDRMEAKWQQCRWPSLQPPGGRPITEDSCPRGVTGGLLRWTLQLARRPSSRERVSLRAVSSPSSDTLSPQLGDTDVRRAGLLWVPTTYQLASDGPVP